MDIAVRVANESSAERLKVGAVIAKDGSLIEFGYNGTPPGWDNKCEDVNEDGSLVTKSEVIHAEVNLFAKILKRNVQQPGYTVYLTHSPCEDCAKLMLFFGVTSLWYIHDYRDDRGLTILKNAGVNINKLVLEN